MKRDYGTWLGVAIVLVLFAVGLMSIAQKPASPGTPLPQSPSPTLIAPVPSPYYYSEVGTPETFPVGGSNVTCSRVVTIKGSEGRMGYRCSGAGGEELAMIVFAKAAQGNGNYSVLRFADAEYAPVVVALKGNSATISFTSIDGKVPETVEAPFSLGASASAEVQELKDYVTGGEFKSLLEKLPISEMISNPPVMNDFRGRLSKVCWAGAYAEGFSFAPGTKFEFSGSAGDFVQGKMAAAPSSFSVETAVVDGRAGGAETTRFLSGSVFKARIGTQSSASHEYAVETEKSLTAVSADVAAPEVSGAFASMASTELKKYLLGEVVRSYQSYVMNLEATLSELEPSDAVVFEIDENRLPALAATIKTEGRLSGAEGLQVMPPEFIIPEKPESPNVPVGKPDSLRDLFSYDVSDYEVPSDKLNFYEKDGVAYGKLELDYATESNYLGGFLRLRDFTVRIRVAPVNRLSEMATYVINVRVVHETSPTIVVDPLSVRFITLGAGDVYEKRQIRITNSLPVDVHVAGCGLGGGAQKTVTVPARNAATPNANTRTFDVGGNKADMNAPEYFCTLTQNGVQLNYQIMGAPADRADYLDMITERKALQDEAELLADEGKDFEAQEKRAAADAINARLNSPEWTEKYGGFFYFKGTLSELTMR